MVARVILPVLAFALTLFGCGNGAGSPGGPVEPPPPVSSAEIVATGTLVFGLCTGPNAGCEYSQIYSNEGTGCANNLHGKVRLYEGETLLESDDWWLDSSLVLAPGESAPVEDCCFDQDTVRRRTRSTVETFWNNVPCG